MKQTNNKENNYGEKGKESLETVKREVSKIYDDATSEKNFQKAF